MGNLVSLKEVNKSHAALVGEKAALLGEASETGSIPEGFVLKSSAFMLHVEPHRDLIVSAFRDDEPEQSKARTIQGLVKSFQMPQSLRNEIVEAYTQLGTHLKTYESSFDLLNDSEDATVAVRSTLFIDNEPICSSTSLAIVGDEELLQAVKKSWSSVFSAETVELLLEERVAFEDIKVASIIHKMIYPHKTAIVFTTDPDTGREDQMIIEACWGLSDYFILDDREPHQYILNKSKLVVVERNSTEQQYAYILDKKTGEKLRKPIPEPERSISVLKDAEAVKLCKIAKRLEEHFDQPLEVEFVVENNKAFIVQIVPLLQDPDVEDIFSMDVDELDSQETDEESDEPEEYPESEVYVEQHEEYESSEHIEDSDEFQEDSDDFEEDIEDEDTEPETEYKSEFEEELHEILHKYSIINPRLSEVFKILQEDILEIYKNQ